MPHQTARLEEKTISGWANSSGSAASVFEARKTEEVLFLLDYAKKAGRSVCPKGAGNSYGDEFQNKDGIVLDLSGFDKILSWNAATGLLIAEPGATIQSILRRALPDNWILPVVPGTRNPTVGGCLSNNVHGKNSYKNGSFGEHVVEFEICLADRGVVSCSREKTPELFYSAIGGLGLLGVITKATLQLKRIGSPFLTVDKWTCPGLEAMLAGIAEAPGKYDHVIGQIDTFGEEGALGRGTIHAAVFSKDGNNEDREFINDLEIPRKLFRLIPHGLPVRIGRFFMCRLFMKTVSTAKFLIDSTHNGKKGALRSFPRFNFLLDRIPGWPRLFKNGFYEFEPLLPGNKAGPVIEQLLALSRKAGMPPFLAAIKLHRKDDFLLSYALDGFSAAFDYPVLPGREKEQKELFSRLHELVADAQGLIYLAKDNTCSREHLAAMYGSRYSRFLALKGKYDPETLFQSNLYRRLFKAA